MAFDSILESAYAVKSSNLFIPRRQIFIRTILILLCIVHYGNSLYVLFRNYWPFATSFTSNDIYLQNI